MKSVNFFGESASISTEFTLVTVVYCFLVEEGRCCL